MLMPVFHGESSEYPKGTILDQEDIEYIISENLSNNQVAAAMLMLSDLTKDDLQMFSESELREQISEVIAKKIYGQVKPLRIGDDVMDAEYFGIRFEDVKRWS